MIKIGVIGLGLIGGSIARDLNAQIGVTLYGYDNNASHLQKALEIGIINQSQNLEYLIENMDVIILAIPVDKIELLLPRILDSINKDTLVIDSGSTKEKICASVSDHPRRGRFLAAHPLAGTEYSGPEAAIKGLFLNKKNIVCEREKTDADALDLGLKILTSLGLETLFLSASEHDKHLAYVSHLSHISSFTLGLTVLDIEKDENQIFNLAGTGFESTVRLAKSAPQTWAPIFNKNSTHLITALDQYINYLQKFKTALEQDDSNASYRLMEEANRIKEVLNK